MYHWKTLNLPSWLLVSCPLWRHGWDRLPGLFFLPSLSPLMIAEAVIPGSSRFHNSYIKVRHSYQSNAFHLWQMNSCYVMPLKFMCKVNRYLRLHMGEFSMGTGEGGEPGEVTPVRRQVLWWWKLRLQPHFSQILYILLVKWFIFTLLQMLCIFSPILQR